MSISALCLAPSTTLDPPQPPTALPLTMRHAPLKPVVFTAHCASFHMSKASSELNGSDECGVLRAMNIISVVSRRTLHVP